MGCPVRSRAPRRMRQSVLPITRIHGLKRPHRSTTHARSPDDASVKAKMIFASSKDALRRRLEGIHIEIQATDFSEISKDAGGSHGGPKLGSANGSPREGPATINGGMACSRGCQAKKVCANP